MHAWESIQKTIDYIEEHLDKDIRIQDLAEIANLSLFYYQRLFTRLVKRPVNEYIKLRRIANASTQLLETNKRILDIAIDLGFNSHESFTRAFKDAYGLTPEGYRLTPVALNHFEKSDLSLNYTLVEENVPLIVEGIIIEISQKTLSESICFVGIEQEHATNEMAYSGNTGIDKLAKQWDEFHQVKTRFQSLKENGCEIGVSSAAPNKGFFRYFVGAEALHTSDSENHTLWEMPKGKYVVCFFEAEDFVSLVSDALIKVLKYLFQTWLPNRKIIPMPFSIERYQSHEPDTNTMEVWVMTSDE